MTDYGLVSIITASYNCSDFIGEMIRSVQAQTYGNWELLISDDCSTDDSREVIERFAKEDSRIRLFKLPKNGGPGIARNNSIKEAKGKFIAFCDSDDRWTPEKLERQLKFMVDNHYNLTFTSYRTCTEEGEINGYVECNSRINKSSIIRDNGIGCLTAVYDAGEIGKFYMPSIKKRQDWCLWIDIISKTGPAYGLREPLAIYRVCKDSVSSHKVALLKYNFDVYHDFLGFNKVLSGMLLYGYFLPYYFYKKFKQKYDYRKHS